MILGGRYPGVICPGSPRRKLPGCNYLGEILLGANCPGGGGIVLDGNCPGNNLLGGNCLGTSVQGGTVLLPRSNIIVSATLSRIETLTYPVFSRDLLFRRDLKFFLI